MRGTLAPVHLPLSRTRAEIFDDLVLDAVEELEHHWAPEVSDIAFAVQDVPPDEPSAEFDPDLVIDRGVRLGQLFRDGLPGASGPLIVLYRHAVGLRAHSDLDRRDIVFAVVSDLAAEFLGKPAP
jgi:predicted Zn-dependent protease with MMP-like domain